MRQLDEQRHVARGVTGRGDGLHTRGDLIFAVLHFPSGRIRALVGKHAFIEPKCRDPDLLAVDVDLASGKIYEAAGVIEMQMTEKYHDRCPPA